MRKFNLILTRSLILTLLAVFTSTLLMAQDRLSGDGSDGTPYLISNDSDWNIFANSNNYATYWASGVHVRLETDITTDKMIGTSSNKYQGVFDGNGHILEFNKGTTSSAFNEDRCAPFRYIQNATIKNLKTKGTIVSKKVYTGGLVSSVYGTSYIKNCISSMTIDCSKVDHDGGGTGGNHKKWDCSAGGFVAQCENDANLYFENCIFDGSIDKGDNTYANRGTGFVSYTNGHTYFDHCLMAGHINLMAGYTYNNKYVSTLSTFVRANDKSYYTYTNQCFYCADYGGVPQTYCEQASTVVDGVCKKYTVDETDYYVPVTVSPELHDMYYTAPVVVSLSYYGKTLVKDTDYTILIEKKNGGEYETVSEITGPTGAYRVTITGKTESDFVGSKVYTFRFLSDEERWQILVDAIAAADCVSGQQLL